MKKTKQKNGQDYLTDVVIKGIQEKKGKNIICLNLKNIANSVCDFFIICHGDSSTQVGAIANSIDAEVKKTLGEDPWHKEGFRNSEWILLDYVNVVVHVFQKESRDFYGIEKLWADAEIKVIPD